MENSSKNNNTEGDLVIVVTAKGSDKSERKKLMEIVVIAVAVILVAAIVLGIILSKNKKSEDVSSGATSQEQSGGFLPQDDDTSDNSPVTADDDVVITFSGVSTTFADELLDFETTSAATQAIKPEFQNTTVAKPQNAKPQVSTTKYLEATTVMSTNPSQGSEKTTKVIESFFAGVYYIDGTMISGGEKTPLEMGMKGSDFHVFSELDGKDMAIVQLDGKTYLMNPDTKQYTEINAAIKKMMGITDDTFSFSFAGIKFDASSPASVTQATHNGADAVCYTYKNDKNHLDFIAIDEEIVQFIVYDDAGEPKTVLELDEFTAEIPDEMFNFKGYHKTNLISFMTSMM